MNSTYKPQYQGSSDSQIETKFREALNGHTALSNFSIHELNYFLEILDPMMSRDIDKAMESYQAKKEPILEVFIIQKFPWLKLSGVEIETRGPAKHPKVSLNHMQKSSSKTFLSLHVLLPKHESLPPAVLLF